MDVEAVVARRLAQAVGVPGCVEVPERLPDSFISVELIGGGGSMFEPCQLAADPRELVCVLEVAGAQCPVGKRQRCHGARDVRTRLDERERL